MTKHIAVLLSGCGCFDGSDLHEAVLTLLTLERAGALAICTAPNIAQRHVLNHVNQEEGDEQRNVLVESARIARGDIRDLKELGVEEVDALIIPGGFGTIKNLSDFAFKGPDAIVNPLVDDMLRALLAAGKPIGASGVAVATITKALCGHDIEVTIGDDPGSAAAIKRMGARHHVCHADQVHVDVTHNIVTTPAYVGGASLKGTATGIERLVETLLDLTQ